MKFDSIEQILERINSFKETGADFPSEKIGELQEGLFPAIVSLGLTRTEVDIVFRAFQQATKCNMTSLRRDFQDYQGLPETENGRESAVTSLLKTVEEAGLELWKDLNGNPWVTLPLETHQEHYSLESKTVKQYLAGHYYEKQRSVLSGGSIQDALLTLSAKALSKEKQHPVFVRVAEIENAVYLDLANETWQVVKVAVTGWQVLEASEVPVRFKRVSGMLPLPTPKRGGRLEDFAQLLNFAGDVDNTPESSKNWRLIVAWLLQALRGDGNYPLLVLGGGQGSGKSTASRLLRNLIDPSTVPLHTFPRSEQDLVVSAANTWCNCYDNLSTMSQWTSDALCRLATGGGFSARKLFTDGEAVAFNVKRPVLLNGITDVVTKQDLVDRSLNVTLPDISKTDRLTEADLMNRYEAMRPGVLGALFRCG